jgi:hypothetical protein
MSRALASLQQDSYVTDKIPDTVIRRQKIDSEANWHGVVETFGRNGLLCKLPYTFYRLPFPKQIPYLSRDHRNQVHFTI